MRAGGRHVPHERELAELLAEHHGLDLLDLGAEPPDPALLDAAHLRAWLAAEAIPWRLSGGGVTWAVTDPVAAQAEIARLQHQPAPFCMAVTTRGDIERALTLALGRDLAGRAATRAPEEASVRAIAGLRARALVVLVTLALALALGGPVALGAGLLALVAINAATTVLRLACAIAGRAQSGDPAAGVRGAAPTPMISLLVPLYREANMIPPLIAALDRLDYPRARLEVRLLLEESDGATRAAVARADLPDWILPMVVPDGQPRTKPRALNHALDFCRGDIVGILDAEDRPEPGQLIDVAAFLAAAGSETACVQCQLSYHNARTNWVSRCFQIEYAIWFEVLLPGFRTLGLPIPLGGTSVYFRREALIGTGAWDAHNVTEDADLGMRLARAGYRTGVLRSVTEEEANCRLLPWVRQRSRWLKGYMVTWLSHMRAPRRLWRELGPAGFAGLNLLFLGAATAYLAMPLFWAALAVWLVEGAPVWAAAMPGWAVWPAMASMAAGQAVMLACAALAMRRRAMADLLFWVPTLPLYWTLGALAAWKAVIELFAAPFYWDKTEHGLAGAQAPSHGPAQSITPSE